jgi:hypothetical protein
MTYLAKQKTEGEHEKPLQDRAGNHRNDWDAKNVA